MTLTRCAASCRSDAQLAAGRPSTKICRRWRIFASVRVPAAPGAATAGRGQVHGSKSPMKLYHRARGPVAVAGPCPERRRAPDDDPDPVQRQAGRRCGAARLTATDMDLSLVAHEPAEVARKGTTTVAAHTLFDIVRKLPDGSEVGIEQDESGGEVTVRAARSVFNLPTLPADEFPAIGQEQLGGQFHDRRRRSGPADRQDPVCDLDRGDALLSQRHPHARHQGWGDRDACAASRPTATGSPASRCRCPMVRPRSRRSSCRARP